MSTPYSVPINAFFKRVEEDQDFFDYIGKDDDQSMEIAAQRAGSFLNEAIWELTSRAKPSIDFYDRDENLKVFNTDWTGQEIYLISSLMYQQYLDRDIAKLKCLNVNYTSTNLRVFDPSNARTTFLELYNKVCAKNDMLIEEYSNKDRLSSSYVGIDYSSYDTEDE